MTFFPSSGLVDMGLRKWCWSFLSEWLRHRSKNIYSHCLSVSLFVQYWETFIHPAVGISTVFKHCVWVLYVLGTLGEHSVNSASSVPTKQPFFKSCMDFKEKPLLLPLPHYDGNICQTVILICVSGTVGSTVRQLAVQHIIESFIAENYFQRVKSTEQHT